MPRQFGRIVRLSVGDASETLVIEGLRIEFDVEASRVSTPNQASISVYNLSRLTRQRIRKEFTRMKLEAGYGDGVGTIFLGELQTVINKKEGVDVITTLSVGDGTKAIQNSTANFTVDPGDDAAQNAILGLIDTFEGVSKGNISAIKTLPGNMRAVVVSGNTKDEMTKLARKHDLEWSIQQGAVEIVKNDSFINETVEISSESGMVGSPEMTEKGVIVKCLLNPAIRPNRVIKVISDFVEFDNAATPSDKRESDQGAGFFRVAKVKYSGNNEDGDFFCTIEGERIYGQKVLA